MKKDELPSKIYIAVQGRDIPVNCQWRENRYGVTIRPLYGQIYATIGTKTGAEHLQKALTALLLRLTGPSLDEISFRPMLDWKGQRVFILGEQLNIIHHPIESLNEKYFLVPPGKDFTAYFDKIFLRWLAKRLPEEAERGRITLPDKYQIKVGKYVSMYASYNGKTQTFNFDRRLFAFKSWIIDTVIDHELVHVLYLNHGEKFKTKLYSMCPAPRYKLARRNLAAGNFEG